MARTIRHSQLFAFTATHYVVYRRQKKDLSAVSHRGRDARTRPFVLGANFPESRGKPVRTSLCFWPRQERIRSHITSSRPQKLIISSCIPSLCVIFLSTDLSAVVFSFSVYCEKKCTVIKSRGLLKTHFLVVNRVNVSLKCI